jgi:ATP-binding protein involved in chromosome partitioning
MMPLDTPLRTTGEELIPGTSGGISVFSLSHVRPEGESMSVRAPVINGLILQCVERILWGELDVLFVDFPPGTGDIPLTLLQSLPFSAAVLVSGPQEISVLDVKKAGEMFCALNVPLAGVIENMSHFIDPASGVKHFPFGTGGGERLSKTFGCPFLGRIPLDPDICRACDAGENFLETNGSSSSAAAVREIAAALRKTLFSSVSEEISGAL